MMNIQGGRSESLCKETIPVDCQEYDAFHLDPAVVHRFNSLNLHNQHHQSPPPKSVAAGRRYRRLKRCRTSGGSLNKASGCGTKTDNNNITTSSTNTTMSSPSSSFRGRTGAFCNCRCTLLNTTTDELNDINRVSNVQSTGELNDINRVSNVQSTGEFKNFDNVVAGLNSQVPPITASIPPVTRPLFTSFSDPISLDHQLPVEFTTPPLLRSKSSDQETTPNSKKLRKFKHRMEEMMQWMGKVMQEEDEDADDNEDTIRLQNNDIINHCKEKADSENEESVCVNKTDKGSIIHFKCPCGGDYEVFLRGNKCFYRLT